MSENQPIPGQLSYWQIDAIKAVAPLVPKGGKMVEVGSLFGLSSSTWAKHVDPSVAVYCVDPWQGNSGVQAIEERYGIKYSIEQFRKFTADLPNIVPKQGYSPRDFLDWSEKIDLYYEDAVHTDPILAANLDFWTSHLAQGGIICGDDYRPRFPDVRRGAERLAEQFGRELLTVENFWCLLPPSEQGGAVDLVRTKLIDLSERYRAETISLGVQARVVIGSATLEPARRQLIVDLSIEQQGLLAWPEAAVAEPLHLEAMVYGDSACIDALAETRVSLNAFQLLPDLQFPASCTFTAEGLPAKLWVQVAVTSGEERFVLRPVSVQPHIVEAPSRADMSRQSADLAPLKGALERMRSREFFLRHSRNPESFGVKPIRHSYYELDRANIAPLEIRSMLSTHEIALLYALARDHYDSGAIVDLGPLMGASTWAFARGLTDAGKGAPGIIHSFDLWRAEGTYDAYLQEFTRGGGGSILGPWMQSVALWPEMIAPHQGNFLDWQWDGRAIGILFVDIAKSWALNDHVVSTMFPCLRPGSVLVQQDYIYWNEYWIHIEMARFRPYFEHCQFLRGATSFYLCTETPPLELCRTPAKLLPYAVQVDLLEEERAIAPAPIQEVMKIAAAKHAIENGDFERARRLLDDVSIEARTDNPLIEVSGIAKSNLEAARAMLEGAQTDTRGLY